MTAPPLKGVRALAPGRPPEIDLLLSCARAPSNPEAVERPRTLLLQGVDWSSLLRLAAYHGLLPLLHRHLLRTGPDLVPANVAQALKGHYRRNALFNLSLAGELHHLLRLLAAQGVPAIPFKGPVLALRAYGDLGLREFCDLDLLVREPDVLKAKALLLAQGYRPEHLLSGAAEAAHLRADCEYNFDHAGTGTHVEVHWRFLPKPFFFPLDREPLWERLQPLSLGGAEVRTFAPEDMLLILCAHGAKHAWESLKWIADVAHLVGAAPGLDWGSLFDQARRLGSLRLLGVGLWLAHSLLGVELPKGAGWHRVRADAMVMALAARVTEHLCRGRPEAATLGEHLLFRLRARERLRDRVHYCLGLAFTPTQSEWALLPLPPGLSPLQTLVRPVRLVSRGGRRLVYHFRS